MTAPPRPIAQVLGMRTDGEHINAVQVACGWCGRKHWHGWHNETDSFRTPPCGAAGATYSIHVGPAESIGLMRSLRGDYATPDDATPDDVVGVVPIHIGYPSSATATPTWWGSSCRRRHWVGSRCGSSWVTR